MLAEGRAYMSAVNYGETVGRMAAVGMNAHTIARALEPLKIEIIDLDKATAVASGLLVPDTKKQGLSLGDRCCLALARILKVPALTADRTWAALKIGVVVKVIR